MEKTLSDRLEFLVAERGQDEATLLAEAVRAGLEALYREALVEAYLLGRIPRETLLAEVGAERLETIEQQRDALRRDVDWGLKSA